MTLLTAHPSPYPWFCPAFVMGMFGSRIPSVGVQPPTLAHPHHRHGLGWQQRPLPPPRVQLPALPPPLLPLSRRRVWQLHSLQAACDSPRGAPSRKAPCKLHWLRGAAASHAPGAPRHTGREALIPWIPPCPRACSSAGQHVAGACAIPQRLLPGGTRNWGAAQDEGTACYLCDILDLRPHEWAFAV